MKLTDVGEARIRGYLYVLDRSLRSFLPPEVARDAVREVESHIRERLSQSEATPDERTAVDVPGAAAGTYDFTCGMGMLHGKLVVE